MHRVIVAAAALNQIPLDWEGNTRTILAAIVDARKQGAKVLCLPELCITGYGCEDAFHAAGVARQALECLKEIAPACKGLFASVGLPLEVRGAIFNVAAVIADGKLVGLVAKRYLAGDGIHYEPRWFKPWPTGVVSSVEIDGTRVPVGDLIFEVSGIRLGFEICEDAWVANRPGIDMAQLGVDIVMNPSASHFAFKKQEIRRRFIVEGSRAFGAGYVYANLLGCEAGRVIYDGDTMIASHGEIIAEGPRFSYRDCVVTIATIDVERSRLIRQRQSSFKPMLTDESRCVRVGGINLVTKMGLAQDVTTAANALRIDNKHEEFFHAVALGLFDYVRKSKSWGFVISLSGGVDSSAATCLVSLMLDAATGELGLAGVKQKLDYNPWIKGVKNVETLKREFLACVYQGTKNSSEVTRAAARDVAAAVGATFYDLDISKLVEGYERIVEDATHIKLSWKDHDIARQNIQARVRSPSVWLIANLRRALLLSTSNRSEAAVGYTTMDGDSSGGLSPLGGIDKAYLRTWLRWLETEGPAGLAPIPALRAVNVQEPTAELRPLQEKQTDEKDLMPYEVLDKIERLAIRDKMMPEEVFEDLTTLFAGRYKAEVLCYWTIRFFRLWSANQWKRERYAPSFHLDDENLDPKTWCRFPILSGGFEAELKELEASRKATSKRK